MQYKILVPFLPVKEDFHPKRNQARQKLATLAVPRFKDLASDVFSELTRRYANLFQEDVSYRFISIFINFLITGFSPAACSTSAYDGFKIV